MYVLVIFRKESGMSFISEALVMGHASPSHYTPIDLQKIRKSSSSFDWKVSKSKRFHPLVKTPAGMSETSPFSYKPDESLKARVYNTSPKYTYPKEKGKSFISAY